MAKRATSESKAAVKSRLKPLDDWLEASDSRLFGAVEDKRWGRRVEFREANGRVVLVVLMGYSPECGWGVDGWDIYRPVCDRNDTAATIMAAMSYTLGEAKP